MRSHNLINSFYKDYKKIHEKIENVINIDSYIVSRILDRSIVFIFIKENLLSKDFKNECFFKENIFENLLNFYISPENYVLDNLKEITQITTLFSIDMTEKNIKINDELMNFIFKTLSKYKWCLSENNDNYYITPDVLGNVFEKYINQKENGAYYTEIDTIRYINDNSILYALFNKLKYKEKILDLILSQNLFSYKKVTAFKDLIKLNYNLEKIYLNLLNLNKDPELALDIIAALKDLKLIDISAGTGAFLIESINLLQKLYVSTYKNLNKITNCLIPNKVDVLTYIIEKNIHGVDIMKDAIEIAKFRLYLKLISESITYNQPIKEDIKFNLKVGNSLTGSITSNEKNVNDNILSNNLNWNIEFNDVISNGGFDCIIGNPPYVEYSKLKEKYTLDNYHTIKCGNIYSYILERSLDLLKSNGIIGVIIPISIISTIRMKPLRKYIEKNCSNVFFSNFGDRPGTLFNGVHQKVTIFIGEKDATNEINLHTSQYYHWYKDERKNLFSNITYVENQFEFENFIYKISDKLQENIIFKIITVNVPISNMFNNTGEYYSYISTRLTFWVKCFLNEKLSSEFKKLKFRTYDESLVFTAIMNSSLYYFFWESMSDEWHITNKELQMFKFNFDQLNDMSKQNLINLALELEKDLETNKVYIGSKQTEYEYRHKKSKTLIDKIDTILKDYYGLTNEEYDFIVDYNLKYRMNDEYETYINQRNTLMKVGN